MTKVWRLLVSVGLMTVLGLALVTSAGRVPGRNSDLDAESMHAEAVAHLHWVIGNRGFGEFFPPQR